MQISDLVQRLYVVIKQAVVNAVESHSRVGILFSGGLDSSVIAKFCEKVGIEAILLTVGLRGSHDITRVREVSKYFPYRVEINALTEKELIDCARKIRDILKELGFLDLMHISIGVAVYKSCEMARKNGLTVILTGQGADELFGGYYRYLRRSEDELEHILLEDFKKAKTVDLRRDSTIASHVGIRLKAPYFDDEVVKTAQKIPASLKIKNGVRKYILREVARKLGLPDAIVSCEKKALQYSTGFEKALRKLGFRIHFNKK